MNWVKKLNCEQIPVAFRRGSTNRPQTFPIDLPIYSWITQCLGGTYINVQLTITITVITEIRCMVTNDIIWLFVTVPWYGIFDNSQIPQCLYGISGNYWLWTIFWLVPWPVLILLKTTISSCFRGPHKHVPDIRNSSLYLIILYELPTPGLS